MTVRILTGDMRERLREMPDASVDAVVTDPPYHLTSIVKRFGSPEAAPARRGKSGAYQRASRGFMGQTWDGGDVAFRAATWAQVLRVMKPGAHLVAFSGTRTYHRMVCAIEDAGFEIRDQIAWLYGSGFPKSHDVSKGIDARQLAGGARTTDLRRIAMGEDYQPSGRGRVNFDHGAGSAMNGASGDGPQTDDAKEWQGWGTALKPAIEPIVLARKPLVGSVAANVLAHGTGAINVDGCRIQAEDAQGGEYTVRRLKPGADLNRTGGNWRPEDADAELYHGEMKAGRWPANVVHDGSDEVVAAFPAGDPPSKARSGKRSGKRSGILGEFIGQDLVSMGHDDAGGSAARFFYSAKADQAERHAGCHDLEFESGGRGNKHPTVKPVDLMRWLVRMVTPPGGTVLDPFMGSGSTLIAADAEQFHAIGVEMNPDYVEIARRRLGHSGGLFAEVEVA